MRLLDAQCGESTTDGGEGVREVLRSREEETFALEVQVQPGKLGAGRRKGMEHVEREIKVVKGTVTFVATVGSAALLSS
jgi:hypothetical protein